MLGPFNPDELFLYLFVFTRMASFLVFCPGFGELFVSTRIRLFMAVFLSLVLTPVLREILPALPANLLPLTLLLLGEMFVGFFMGLSIRLFIYVLESAGAMISYMMGLSNVMGVSPLMAQQSSIISSFLSIFGLMMIFALNLHHDMLMAISNSYDFFVPGQWFALGDFSDFFTRQVSGYFLLAFQLSSPFIVYVIIFYLGMGLISRLVVHVQIFFISLPMQILLGYLAFFTIISALMLWYVEHFEERISMFIGR
jgi:flagellar biosynthesis protein FliR